MKEREEEGRADEGQAQGRGEKRRRGERTGHPPIIITDGSARFDGSGVDEDNLSASATTANDILVQLDGEGMHNHYVPEDPPTYSASSLRKIDSIRVEDGSTHAHMCRGVPPDCRIVVTDKHRNNGNESSIAIDATGPGIVIILPDDYVRRHGNGERKKLLGALKKIKSMEVFDRLGNPVHDCEVVRSGKDVRIVICDDKCVE
jgi:hypothetical protein